MEKYSDKIITFLPSSEIEPSAMEQIKNFSRTEARKRFTMEDMDRDMKGISYKRSSEFIDELPGAYKNIDAVIENSKELVNVVHTLHQVLNVKGN